MPRHHRAATATAASNTRVGDLTSASISTLLPPALQIVPTAAAAAATAVLTSSLVSASSAAPRRRLPKKIPLLDSASPAGAGAGASAAGSDRRQRDRHSKSSASAHLSPSSISSIPPSSTSLRTHLGGFGAKVSGPSLPVVRAGATFLSTLSASVALSASLHPPSNPSSAPPSPCLVPIGGSGIRASYTSDASPSSQPIHLTTSTLVAAANMSSSDLEPQESAAAVAKPLPALDFVPATSEDERTAGLKLVADSIAQRRQLASYAVMTHPFCLGLAGLCFSGVYKWLYRSPGDAALVFTTCIGVLMAGLVGIRAMVRPYLDLAESINYSWLGDAGEVVVARWGDGEDRKVIGALVYGLEKSEGVRGGKKGKKVAVVRAWTTRQRERGKGVGKGLVEETVKLVKARGIDDVRWQEGNIYETRILPAWANGGFEDGLKACKQKLEEYIMEYSRK